jgi:GAF domain-containing protein
MSFLTDIQTICGQLDRHEVTREAFVERCTRLIAASVGCSHAGIWVFLDSTDGMVLRCLGIYNSAADRMTKAHDEYDRSGSYFAALERDGHVVAADARAHPATADFFAERLEPSGVSSFMAAAFSVNGTLFGTFTCTQAGSPMHWSSAQLSALKRIGARASLTLASATSFTMATLPAPLMELPPFVRNADESG